MSFEDLKRFLKSKNEDAPDLTAIADQKFDRFGGGCNPIRKKMSDLLYVCSVSIAARISARCELEIASEKCVITCTRRLS